MTEQTPDADSKVVAMPGRQELPDCTITIEASNTRYRCNHDRITLDELRRVVRCTDCQQVFDPFSYLMSNAMTITRAWSDYRSVRQRQQETQNTVEALAKEEKRLKARLKTLKDKVEPGIDIKGRYL